MSSNQQPVRWGVLATGKIAVTVTDDLALLPDARLLAAASRTPGRAEAFAATQGFERAYSSYEELLADPEVDVVYVATPHAQHHRWVSAAIAAGKAVLCEKAFTCTAAATEDLVGQAQERGVFLMEAMWTRFIPSVVRLRRLLAEGAIGEVRTVHASLGFPAPYDPASRLWDPAQGGGSLLDIGVYPVSFAQMVLGSPASVTARGALAPSGVDAEASLLLGWDGGQQATLSGSLTADTARTAVICGTQGRIELAAPFHHAPRLVLHRTGADPQELAEEPLGRGYTGQLREVQECLRAGRTQSETMPLADTVAVMHILEEALTQLEVVRGDEGFPR